MRVDIPPPHTRKEAELLGLLPDQTRAVHWWAVPKAKNRERLEQLAHTIGLGGRTFFTDTDCLGRLVAELVSLPGVWLSYSRGSGWYAIWNRDRVLPKSVDRRSVVRVVDRLRDSRLVEHCIGFKKKKGDGFQSRVRALPSLLALFPSAAGFEASPDAPLVIVKDEDGQPCAPLSPEAYEAACRKVATLREWIRTFEIEAPAHPGHMELTQMFSSADMTKHGRFYWWGQNLSKEQRLAIKLNSHPVAELDYAQNHPSILYNELGLDVPANAYEVEGFSRDLVKATFNRMLNSNSEPGTIQKLAYELESAERAKHLVSSLLAIHQPLVDAGKFWSGVGLSLMRRDADIAYLVMLWAKLKRIPLLPVHDSFIVPREHASATKKQLEDAYHAHMGVRPVVKVSCAEPEHAE